MRTLRLLHMRLPASALPAAPPSLLIGGLRCAALLLGPRDLLLEDVELDRPEGGLGEVVGAAVTFKEDAGTKPSVEELTKLCQANLAKFKVPEKIVLWAEPELPKGATGKIVKKDIKDIVVKSMASKL